MKLKAMLMVLLVASVMVLGGCQKTESAQTSEMVAADVPGTERNRPDVPNPGLDGVTLLTLGTFKLEGSDNAVTSEQANKLLPLWKLIQSGTLTSDVETQAVIRQIEGVMTEAQLTTIDAMGLTMEDMLAWMQEQGIEMPAIEMGSPDGALAEGPGGPGGMADMSEEERAQMREQFQT